MNRKELVALSMMALMATTGCASIVNGSGQSVGISSSPSGADVIVDGARIGVTPMIANIKRRESHVVSFEMPGYRTQQLTLTKSMSGWVWGNLLWSPVGFLIGMGVDAASGGMYKLAPEQLVTTLREEAVTPRRTAAPILEQPTGTGSADAPL